MATYASSACASTVPAKTAVQGVISKTGSYKITTALNKTANVFQMVKVPAGATVLDVILYAPQIDSSTGQSIGVGDGDSTSYYLAAETTVGRAAGSTRGKAFVPKKYTEEDTIDIILTAGATTAVEGTVHLTVLYTMDA